jgi:CRP-like cAMP-binding protein
MQQKQDACDPNGNALLRFVPEKELRALASHLEAFSLDLGQNIYEPNGPIEYVYFICHGVVSLVKNLDDGDTVEVATIGPEGMVGVPIVLGSNATDNRAFVQIPGESLRMKTSVFKRLLKDLPKLQALLLRYTLALLNQIAQSAACNRSHSVDERCARWLLMTHDRVKKDAFPLTQEFLGQMLGVHRPTVSVAAGMLQRAGFIQYTRGVITVTDRKGLENASCGCYRAITDEYRRLLSGE